MKRPTGPRASKFRQRKFEVLRSLPTIPKDGLLGSLCVQRRRCGKPTCHCVDGDGHEAWSFTFMVEGKKRVVHVPTVWVENIQRRVAQGREFKDAVAEVFAANAELLALELQQRPR